MPVFKGIVRSFALEGQAWVRWLQSPEPYLEDLPVSWQSEVISLQQPLWLVGPHGLIGVLLHAARLHVIGLQLSSLMQ